ncbi:MAG: sigma-70 region 4 domain-containing protein [Acidipropionibacterium sp.]|nr:sigma-70 region 4 domain-containing protein [Acidipropionibacterium sp.]
MTSTTASPDVSSIPPCATLTEVFQHPFLEEDATPRSAEQRRLHTNLTARATDVCMNCPYFEDCLETSISEHDVAGFVAGTTSRQRTRIRGLLHVRVQPDDMDALVGILSSGRQIATHDVVRLRRSHPGEPLDFIAQSLGCSLSTVKRHLRRARTEADEPTPFIATRPDRADIITAFESVTGMSRSAEETEAA